MISIHLMHELFRPLAGASNPHLQTLLPRLVRRRVQLQLSIWSNSNDHSLATR